MYRCGPWDGRARGGGRGRVDEDGRVIAGASAPCRRTRSVYPTASCRPPSSPACGVSDCVRRGGGSWVTWHDENQETNLKGVYVAGEVGGIGGRTWRRPRVASQPLRRRVPWASPIPADGARGSKRSAPDWPRPGISPASPGYAALKPALFDLITDDTIVCRCERVTAREVKAAIADGDATLRGVKGRTRAGMGRCQGRICGHLVSRLIAKQTGVGMAHILLDTPELR